jgi:hypothetical protein
MSPIQKLDKSCGLTPKQIGAIKFMIKQSIGLELPFLPDHVETKLFIEGRDPWTYAWRLINQDSKNPTHPVSVEVDVKLKKEFFQYQTETHHTFLCSLELLPDMFTSKPRVRKSERSDHA